MPRKSCWRNTEFSTNAIFVGTLGEWVLSQRAWPLFQLGKELRMFRSPAIVVHGFFLSNVRWEDLFSAEPVWRLRGVFLGSKGPVNPGF